MKKFTRFALLVACCAVFSAAVIATGVFGVRTVKGDSEIAIGGTKTTVEVTDASMLFESWNNDTATYGVNKNGAWRKDSYNQGNRQIPIKEKLTLSDTKDAYLKFALPVYDGEGTLLSDKIATEVIFVLTNDEGKELQIKFLTGDDQHANGINYCVSKTSAGWVGYWCSTRIPGDFTADNLIGLKFSKRAGESIAMLNSDGNWYADPNMNESGEDRTDVTSFFNTETLKINVMYWAEGQSAEKSFDDKNRKHNRCCGKFRQFFFRQRIGMRFVAEYGSRSMRAYACCRSGFRDKKKTRLRIKT